MMTTAGDPRALALDVSPLGGAEHPRGIHCLTIVAWPRFRRQPLAPTARPCGLRGLTARRGQAKRAIMPWMQTNASRCSTARTTSLTKAIVR